MTTEAKRSAGLLAIGGAAVAIAWLVGDVGLNAWHERQLDVTRLPDATPSLPVEEPTVARPRTPATSPAVPAESLPTIAFGYGTTARVVKVERTRDPARFSGLMGRDQPPPADDAPTVAIVTVAFDDAGEMSEREHAVRLNGRRPGRYARRAFGLAMPSRVVEAATYVDPEDDRVSVDVGAAVGPFVEAARIAPGDAAPRVAPDVELPVTIVGLRVHERSVVLELEPRDGVDGPPDDQSWLVQAVRHDGSRLTANTVRSGDGVAEAGVRVPSKDVARVELRYRPIVWRHVGDVALPIEPEPTTRTVP